MVAMSYSLLGAWLTIPRDNLMIANSISGNPSLVTTGKLGGNLCTHPFLGVTEFRQPGRGDLTGKGSSRITARLLILSEKRVLRIESSIRLNRLEEAEQRPRREGHHAGCLGWGRNKVPGTGCGES